MKVSILTETIRVDKEVHNNLINKIFEESLKLEKGDIEFVQLNGFNPQGKNDLLGQLHVAINLLTERYSDLDVVIVIVDGDKLTRNKQKTVVENLLLSKRVKFPVEQIVIGVAIRNIEAWLLADPGPVNRMFGKGVVRRFPNPERVKDPKTEMKQIYGKYCADRRSKSLLVPKYDEFLIQISQGVSLKNLISTLPSFAWLVKDLNLVSKKYLSPKKRGR